MFVDVSVETIFKNESQFFYQSTVKIVNFTNEFNKNISASTELKKTEDMFKKNSTTTNVVGKYFFIFLYLCD